MSTQEPTTEMTPLEYLKQADKAMADGNGQRAAGLLCTAIEGAIVRLAFERGIEGEPASMIWLKRWMGRALPKVIITGVILPMSLHCAFTQRKNCWKTMNLKAMAWLLAS